VSAAARHLVIVGGGVIGLTCALEAASSGFEVTVVDPEPGRGAAWVAAGMLAPTAEAHFGEEELVRLLVAGASVWPAFAEDLERRIDASIGFVATGTLLVAKDVGDRAELARTAAFQRSLDLVVHELRANELRTLEPSLSPALAGGALLPDDHQVSNRLLLEGLELACASLGVTFVRQRAKAINVGADRATAILEGSGELTAPDLLLCLGAATGTMGAPISHLPAVRPVKGHILRLRGPEPVLERTIRATVRGRSVYLVPRRDGELVVGATVEERGFDQRVQAGEVFSLLDDARRVVPGIDELELVEASCGLRPGTTSNAPMVGRVDDGPILVATGHYRNGILLAPLTAQLIVAELLDRPHEAAVLVRPPTGGDG